MEEEHSRWMAYQAARRFSGEIHGCYACMPGADVLPDHAGGAVHSPQPENSSSPNTVNGLTAGDASVTGRAANGDANGSFAMASPATRVTGAGVRVTAAPAGAYKSRTSPTSSSGSPSPTSYSGDAHAQVSMGDLESPNVTRSGDGGDTRKAAAGAGADTSLLKTIPETRQLTLQFEGLCGWVPGQVQQPGILKRAAKAAVATCSKRAAESKPKERQIMFNLTGGWGWFGGASKSGGVARSGSLRHLHHALSQ
jgi:hypothetical protein